MTYDHWKTTNPADQWLGPEPEEDGMDDWSGVLRPAIMAYLKAEPLEDGQIAAIRAYLRQAWIGPDTGLLRRRIDGINSRQAISRWLNDALDLPL
jgi:hypothetical protein